MAESQAAIGWHQILKGRFSKLWASTQDRYLGSRATVKADGSKWVTRIIESIFIEWLKLWKLRNEDRHGRDVESRRQAETRQTVRELEQFYDAHKDTVTVRLQWLFEEPIEVRREKNIGIIIQWLNTWKPIVEKSYNTALTTGWQIYKRTHTLPIFPSIMTQYHFFPSLLVALHTSDST